MPCLCYARFTWLGDEKTTNGLCLHISPSVLTLVQVHFPIHALFRLRGSPGCRKCPHVTKAIASYVDSLVFLGWALADGPCHGTSTGHAHQRSSVQYSSTSPRPRLSPSPELQIHTQHPVVFQLGKPRACPPLHRTSPNRSGSGPGSALAPTFPHAEPAREEHASWPRLVVFRSATLCVLSQSLSGFTLSPSRYGRVKSSANAQRVRALLAVKMALACRQPICCGRFSRPGSVLEATLPLVTICLSCLKFHCDRRQPWHSQTKRIKAF